MTKGQVALATIISCACVGVVLGIGSHIWQDEERHLFWLHAMTVCFSLIGVLPWLGNAWKD
jgi:hypothetical protein